LAHSPSHGRKQRRDPGSDRGTGGRSRSDGGEPAEGDFGEEGRGGKRSSERPFQIELVHARRSHLSWMIACLVLGVLLLWKLAIIGKIVGVVLLLIAAISGRRLLRTLLNEPGTIRVDRDQVALPVGLCRGRSRDFSFSDIKHAFFLRRAVPWTRAGPILVVEAGDSIFTYPRDWFASETEQRRVLEAINHRLGRM